MEYFEVILPKKYKPISKEQRRKYSGRNAIEIEKQLSGLPYSESMCKTRLKVPIESDRWKKLKKVK